MKNSSQELLEETASLGKSRVVEIFKTAVTHPAEAAILVQALQTRFPACRINFDLQDCDKILRIEGQPCEIDVHAVLQLVKSRRYFIEWIED